MTKPTQSQMVTVKAAAQIIGLPVSTVRRYAATGIFAGARFVHPEAGPDYWLIPESSLKHFTRPARGYHSWKANRYR